MRFKFANKLDQNEQGQSTGSVPICAILGDPDNSEVHIEKGDDYFYLFEFPASSYMVLSATEGTTGGYIEPGPSLLHTGASYASDILVGPSKSNLVATLTDAATGDYKIYDLLTNKVFDDFVIVEPTSKSIYLGAEDYLNKVLVYRTEADAERFVKISPRYMKDIDWNISDNKIHFINDDFITGEEVRIASNPLNKVEALWTDREWYKKWIIHLPRKTELNTNSTVEIKSTKSRHKYIKEEKVYNLRPRLVKTNHKI